MELGVPLLRLAAGYIWGRWQEPLPVFSVVDAGSVLEQTWEDICVFSGERELECCVVMDLILRLDFQADLSTR